MRLPALILAALFLTAAGCGWNVNYDRVNVRVIDGDTGRPVSHASVSAPRGSWGATGDRDTADADGRATLRVARHVGRGVEADPAGYLSSVNYRGGVGEVTILVYRPPRPLAGITIPAGYRGILRIGTRDGGPAAMPQPPDPGPPWLGGKREFYTKADVSGLTDVAPPPRLTPFQGLAEPWIARFDDGTPLRYENPIARSGTSGQYLNGLPDIRDLVPPRDDGVALFHLGGRYNYRPPSPEEANYYRFVGEGWGVYFVGTRDAAAAEQRRLVEGATPLDSRRPDAPGYTFRPDPLDIDALEVGVHMTPRL